MMLGDDPQEDNCYREDNLVELKRKIVCGMDIQIERIYARKNEFQTTQLEEVRKLHEARYRMQSEQEDHRSEYDTDLDNFKRTQEVVVDFPRVIDLNVGGTPFSTTLKTLRNVPGSLFSAMFSGSIEIEKRDKDKAYFIDRRGGMVFRKILDFLRDEKVDIQALPEHDIQALITEAEYYRLPKLAAHLTANLGKPPTLLSPSDAVHDCVNVSVASPHSSALIGRFDQSASTTAAAAVPVRRAYSSRPVPKPLPLSNNSGTQEDDVNGGIGGLVKLHRQFLKEIERTVQEVEEDWKQLQTTKSEVLAEIEAQRIAGEEELTRNWAELHRVVSAYNEIKGEVMAFQAPITLNVGGSIFTTTLRTLQKVPGSYFSSTFTGEISRNGLERDEHGNCFIERTGGPVFNTVLNFLRTGDIEDVEVLSVHDRRAVVKEAEFYQLPQLKELLTSRYLARNISPDALVIRNPSARVPVAPPPHPSSVSPPLLFASYFYDDSSSSQPVPTSGGNNRRMQTRRPMMTRRMRSRIMEITEEEGKNEGKSDKINDAVYGKKNVAEQQQQQTGPPSPPPMSSSAGGGGDGQRDAIQAAVKEAMEGYFMKLMGGKDDSNSCCEEEVVGSKGKNPANSGKRKQRQESCQVGNKNEDLVVEMDSASQQGGARKVRKTRAPARGGRAKKTTDDGQQ